MHHQVSYRWSMLSVSVSFTHTIKTLGPMFTIFFSRLLLSERMSFTRLLSVLPVVLGVAITTSTEVEFALVPPTRTRRLQLGLHASHRSPQPNAQPSLQPSPQPSALSPQPSAHPFSGRLLLCDELDCLPGAPIYTCALPPARCLLLPDTKAASAPPPPSTRHPPPSTLHPHTGATVGALEASSGRRACLQA